MNQNNVSNAFKIFGSGFEIGPHNTVKQTGPCLWPGYGPKSDATPFQPSTLLYMEDATDGWVHDNKFYWRCSMMDLDVSDRVVFEHNTMTSTEKGVVPHGNSISGSVPRRFHAPWPFISCSNVPASSSSLSSSLLSSQVWLQKPSVEPLVERRAQQSKPAKL